MLRCSEIQNQERIMTTKQNRRWLFLLPILLLVALVIWACNGSTQPSTTPADAEQPVAATEATTIAPTVAPAAEPAVEPAAPLTDTTTTAAPAAETSSQASADVRVFTIDQTQSQARFTLDEELMGSPKTVVGATQLVNGEISIDVANPAQTVIGPIQIDARGFATDSSRRDGAIQRFILGTNDDANRFIIFTPTSISGVPASVVVGDAFELQVSGDLTISGVTKPVTFVTTITVDAETQISGLATAQVLRSDFNLTIPSVPSVANVTDEVKLELEFVATAA
jgi:polyisoprenoid-binding protein YceI